MSREHPYYGEPVDAGLVAHVATHHWGAVRLSVASAPAFLSRLKRGAYLYTLASGDQLEPVILETDGWLFEVVMGMTRYRFDPKDVLPINVDEYKVCKVVNDNGGLSVVSYRAVSQAPGPNHRLPILPERIFQAPELAL